MRTDDRTGFVLHLAGRLNIDPATAAAEVAAYDRACSPTTSATTATSSAGSSTPPDPDLDCTVRPDDVPAPVSVTDQLPPTSSPRRAEHSDRKLPMLQRAWGLPLQ